MNDRARLLPLLALLLLPGCLGQSGSPPACIQHCLCSVGYQRAPLRGRVTQLVPLAVEVTERPSDGGYSDVEVGTIIGGTQSTCAVEPKVDVGDAVLVYYERGEQDGAECPESRQCIHDCEVTLERDVSPPATQDEQRAAGEAYEACLLECPTTTAPACSARREEALFGGVIRIAVETEEGYDFGVDIRGRELLLQEHELEVLADPIACYEWSYPQGCNDTI